MSKNPEPNIYEQAFEKSDKTDAILLVDEKKLHVNKALLSYHSDFFAALFNSNFKEKSMDEVPIEEVEFEDFAILLSLVHEKPFEITYSNAENLLELADRFFLNNAKVHLEFFVKHSTGFNRLKKLKLADKYNLENLLEHALGLYDSKESVEHLFSPCNRDFSDKLKVKIFDKICQSKAGDYIFDELSFDN